MPADARLTIHPAHRAMVAESCALAVALTWISAAAGWPPARIGVPVLLVTGFAAGLAVSWSARSVAFACPVATWGIVLAGWLAYARADGHLWSWTVAGALGLPAIVLTIWTVVAYAVHHENMRADAATSEARRLRAKLARWERALDGCGYSGIRALSADKTRMGHEVTLRLPASGRITLRTLINGADNVATALRLPLGSVSFAEGRHAGEVLMTLDETDVLSAVVPFPAASGLMTITKPVPLGVRGGGRPAAVLFREVQALITGVTGAGKTNLLNVMIAQFTRCTDCLVWVIDLKGGRLAAPWVRPWVEGRCPAPAVDWVATTREEVEIMLRAIDRVIDSRGASLVGGSKIKPTDDLPQIIVIADEIADVFGDVPRNEQGDGSTSNLTLASLGSRVTRKGRSEAAMFAWATQKGTVDFTGSTAIKSQCKLRFMLGTASESDARAVTDSTQGSRLLAQAEHPGSVLITLPGDKGVELIKTYRLDADDDATRIDELSEAAGYWRPRPDQRAADAMGGEYARRWERSPLYRELDGQRTGPAAASPADPAGPETGTRTGTVTVARPAQAAADQTADQFREIVAGLDQAAPDPRNRMYALLAERPNFGLSVVEIDTQLKREGLGVHRSTIHRWLADDVKSGIVERPSDGGPGARYKLRHDGGQQQAG